MDPSTGDPTHTAGWHQDPDYIPRGMSEGSGWKGAVAPAGKRAWHNETRPRSCVAGTCPQKTRQLNHRRCSLAKDCPQLIMKGAVLVGQAASKCPARRHLSREATCGRTAGPTSQPASSGFLTPTSSVPDLTPGSCSGESEALQRRTANSCRAPGLPRQSPLPLPAAPAGLCSERRRTRRTQSVGPFIF